MNVERQESGRFVLFALACVAILLAAFLFRGHDGTSQATTQAEPSSTYALAPPPSASVFLARLQQQRQEVETSARRFLAAFFRYEVGETGRAVRRSLWITCTPGFYAVLMRRPVAPPATGFPARASLQRLRVSFVSSSANRALVSGTATRDGLPEEFSFVFSRRSGAWLASAPGE